LAYEPAAIVWHRHPTELSAVTDHTFSYGVGLGAAIGKLLLDRRHRRAIARLVPRAITYWLDPHSRKNAGQAVISNSKLRETAGVIWGPFTYLASRAAAARRR
jgi:hypothetical protein